MPGMQWYAIVYSNRSMPVIGADVMGIIELALAQLATYCIF